MPTVQILGFRTARTLPQLTDGIAAARRAGRRVLVLVPAQYTLQAERELLEGLRVPGLMDVDVLSPRRLAARVRERAGFPPRQALDDCGRAMVISQVLQREQKRLTYYGSSVAQPGLPDQMGQLIADLEQTGLDPEWLERTAESAARTLTREKERDIAHIWRAYREKLSGRFMDAEEAERALLDRIADSGVAAGADVYVCGFDLIPSPFAALIGRMAGLAHSVTVALTLCGKYDGDSRAFRAQIRTAENLQMILDRAGVRSSVILPETQIREAPRAAELRHLERNLFAETPSPWPDACPAIRLHTAANPFDEALFAAAQLRRWHEEGIPWPRMGLTLADPGLAGIAAATLSAAGIPHYLARMDSAARHGLCRLLIAATRAVATGYEQRAMLDLLDSGFTPLTDEEAIRLRRYAVENGIRWKKWTAPFTRGDQAAEMEELRGRLMPPLTELRLALERAGDGSGAAEALWAFLEANDSYSKLLLREEELLRRGLQVEAAQNRQVWQKLLSLLEQMHALLAGEKAGLREVARLVESGLASAQLGALPPTGDEVIVGEAGHLMTGELDAMAVMGLHDGVTAADSDGLLSDMEREELSKAAYLPVGRTAETRGDLRRAAFYRTLTAPARALTLTRAGMDAAGKTLQSATLVEDLRQVFPQLRETGGVAAETETLPLSPQLAMERLPQLARGGALDETWQEAWDRLRADETWRPRAAELLRGMDAPVEAKPLPEKTAGAIFQQEEVSISRLETFAQCAFRHFVRYGLTPVIPRDFDFMADEKGTFFHAVLCRYAMLSAEHPAWPGLPDAEIDRLVEAAAAPEREKWLAGPLTEDETGRAQGEEYMRVVRRAAWMFTRHARESGFISASAEVRFGEPGGLPPVILHLKNGRTVALKGCIDRIDRWQGDEGVYLRVVDLKSGDVKLDRQKMFWGLQLQLMIYLAAAEQGERALPAGAYYFRVQDPLVETDEDIRAEAERLLAKEMRLSGVTLEDVSVIEAMNGERGEILGAVLNADGTPRKGGMTADLRGMHALMAWSRRLAAEMAQRIQEGRIDISPAKLGDWTACQWCEYKGVCARDEKRRGGRFRDLSVDKDEAWLRMTGKAETDADKDE